MTAGAGITIAETLDRFLAEDKKRAPEDAEQSEFLLDNLVSFLEGYGYQYVADEPDTNVIALGIFDESDEGERDFIDSYRPEIIPDSLREFLYDWNIRKYLGDEDDAKATALLMERLMEWLADEGLADREEAAEAAVLARTASEDLPRAHRLSGLFYDLAKAAGAGDASEPDDSVDDSLAITRVEPGRLWLEGDVGPIKVPVKLSQLAVVGWTVNVLAEKRAGKWVILETGFVYP
ncbi:MAG: hypothetical protein U9O18_02175 [Chloroflexota bacterium]|nr:hypothetical protein [Chloroflexota bacterium]